MDLSNLVPIVEFMPWNIACIWLSNDTCTEDDIESIRWADEQI